MGKIKKKFWNLSISELFFKTGFSRFGGDKRDRTADLLNAIQALSQLSYTPIFALRNDSLCIIAGVYIFVKGAGKNSGRKNSILITILERGSYKGIW